MLLDTVRQDILKHDKHLSPITTEAQMYLESGYRPGQKMSELASPPNHNLFGIKANDPEFTEAKKGIIWDWFWTHEYEDGKKVRVKDKFRIYTSYQASIEDHDNFFVSTPARVERYRKTREAVSLEQEIVELGKSGYATDPDYAKKIRNMIKEYKIDEKYDTSKIDKFNKKGSTKMATHLIIAGHGRNPNNNYFDPGATGKISMGEHRYMRDVLFPLMKKYTPEDVKAVYFSDYNVYSKGNLVSLAKSYGSDTIVTEMHFDATGNNVASGGHVIVHKSFKADKIDLAIRDAIKEAVGLAYPIHMGDKGISGRGDLANPNRAANGGVNYRLPELGFGTNQKDANYMLTQADSYAKLLCKALFGKVKDNVSKPIKLDGSHVVVHGEYLWLIAEKYGITVQNLKDWNKLTSNIIYTGQVLKVEKTDEVIEEGEPDPEVSTPIEDQPVDEGEETKAIELDPWHFYNNDGKVYKISETELVYE